MKGQIKQWPENCTEKWKRRKRKRSEVIDSVWEHWENKTVRGESSAKNVLMQTNVLKCKSAIFSQVSEGEQYA